MERWPHAQQKNERDLTIYTEQIQYLQKIIFNIRVPREVSNVANMMEFNWAYPFSDNFIQTMPPRQKTW